MDVNVPANPEDVAKALREVNQLRVEAMYFLGGLALLLFLYFLISKFLANRREKETEESKGHRAEMYAKVQADQAVAINNLAQAFTDHVTAEKIVAHNMVGVTQTLHKVETAMQTMITKQAGTLPRDDSIRMIRDRFIQNVYREFRSVLEWSMRENDYTGRPEYIKRKVKTALGDVLIEARQYLCSFNLSVDARRFFKTLPDPGGERFVLCDLVWKEVEPIFRQSHKNEIQLKQKIEEASLAVENVVKDYVTTCGHGTECHIDFRESLKANKSGAQLMAARTTRLLETGAHPPLHDFDSENDSEDDNDKSRD